LGFFATFELLIIGNKLYFNQIAEFGGNRKIVIGLLPDKIFLEYALMLR